MRMVLEAAAPRAPFSHQNLIAASKAAAVSSAIGGNRERSVLHRFPRSSSLKSLESLQSQHYEKRHTLRRVSSANFEGSSLNPIMFGIEPEAPEWPEREKIKQEVIREKIERKANALDLPFSLKMIRKKQQKMKESTSHLGLDSVSGLACTHSLQKAFSSMVSIILELQGKALQMRETVTSDNLDLLLEGVHREMQMSFTWLFQQIFSLSPTFMTEVMILVSDFCVHSIAKGIAPTSTVVDEEEEVTTAIPTSQPNQTPEKISEEDEEASLIPQKQEEITVDSVSPPNVKLELDNYEYLITDLTYQMNLFEDPHNTLLLCNYAQFLQLVAHDYNRAEECYKRALQIDPTDAMTMTLYANFLWLIRNDLIGAEKLYVGASETESEISYHASTYANFLWKTGGIGTCFPLDMPLNDQETA